MTELRRRVGDWVLWAPALVVLVAAMFHACPAYGQSLSGGAGVLTGPSSSMRPTRRPQRTSS